MRVRLGRASAFRPLSTNGCNGGWFAKHKEPISTDYAVAVSGYPYTVRLAEPANAHRLTQGRRLTHATHMCLGTVTEVRRYTKYPPPCTATNRRFHSAAAREVPQTSRSYNPHVRGLLRLRLERGLHVVFDVLDQRREFRLQLGHLALVRRHQSFHLAVLLCA